MTDPRQPLIDECERHREDCAYTATTFTIWLRWLRGIRGFCVTAPVVFGAIATWKIVAQGSPTWAAVCALLATVIPPAYRASNVGAAITDYTKLAGEFTNLRDRFRHAARVSSQMQFSEFDGEVKQLVDRLDAARSHALTPPELLFILARKKHRAGHYQHDYNNRSGSHNAGGA